MAKGQAMRADFAARSVINSGCNSAHTTRPTNAHGICPTNTHEKCVPLTPDEKYIEELMEKVTCERIVVTMMARIKNDIAIRTAINATDPYYLPRRLKQELNELFPEL